MSIRFNHPVKSIIFRIMMNEDPEKIKKQRYDYEIKQLCDKMTKLSLKFPLTYQAYVESLSQEKQTNLSEYEIGENKWLENIRLNDGFVSIFEGYDHLGY